MRISKTTTEYIKGLVREKAQPKIDALNASLEKAKEKDKALRAGFKAEIEKLREKATSDARRIAKKFKIDVFHYIGWCGETYDSDVEADFDEFTKDGTFTPMTAEIKKTENLVKELDAEIEKKCTEIVARLSLGGTAADLDRLIAELKF